MKRKSHLYNTKMPEPKFNTESPRHKEYEATQAKSKALAKAKGEKKAKK